MVFIGWIVRVCSTPMKRGMAAHYAALRYRMMRWDLDIWSVSATLTPAEMLYFLEMRKNFITFA
jgi:hypothetical protein